MKEIHYFVIITLLLFSTNLRAQIYGCNDTEATNYNAFATLNDGSCTYSLDTISPISSFNLHNTISETSGLIKWNNKLWTHIDSGGNNEIFALDTLNGNIINSVSLIGTINKDWEEISQDIDFIYIGDFGNNINGNRTDLKILRISKNSILNNTPIIDTIRFSYSNQIDFTAKGINNSDFDCEAFIVSEDSIFLFTKQWITEETSIYSLPKNPGSYVANLKSTLDVNGLITGAVHLESKKIIALCGYSNIMQPFIYLLYDFEGLDYTLGNKRKITLSIPYHQVEGITTTNGKKFYISNEKLSQLSVYSKLHIFDLTSFLDNHLSSVLSISENEIEHDLKVYPVPANNFIQVGSTNSAFNENYVLINQLGQIVLSGRITQEDQRIDISMLPDGMYVLKIGAHREKTFKKVIKSTLNY